MGGKLTGDLWKHLEKYTSDRSRDRPKFCVKIGANASKNYWGFGFGYLENLSPSYCIEQIENFPIFAENRELICIYNFYRFRHLQNFRKNTPFLSKVLRGTL